MHPFRAGYRTPHPRQKLILVLSALAVVIVAGLYMWAAMPRPDVPAPPARGNVVRHEMTPEELAFSLMVAVLFFGTTYATGMVLYLHFGDTEGYTVVTFHDSFSGWIKLKATANRSASVGPYWFEFPSYVAPHDDLESRSPIGFDWLRSPGAICRKQLSSN